MKNKRLSQKNIVLIFAVIVNLQLGVSYSWSVFSKALIDLEGWAYTDAVLPGTVTSISYAVSMLVFGFFQEKFGPRLTMKIGALFMGSGLFLAAYFLTVPGISIGYGILHGCGVGACFSTTQATTLKWVPANRQGLVTGITSSAFGMSSVIISWIADRLIRMGGISLAFYALGIFIFIVVLISSHFFLLPEKSDLDFRTDRDIKKLPPASTDMNCFQMIKTKTFFYILGIYIFASAAAMVPINHISMIASGRNCQYVQFAFVWKIRFFPVPDHRRYDRWLALRHAYGHGSGSGQ